jgi:hypothetical protein
MASKSQKKAMTQSTRSSNATAKVSSKCIHWKTVSDAIAPFDTQVYPRNPEVHLVFINVICNSANHHGFSLARTLLNELLLATVLSQLQPLPFDQLSTHARLALHCMEVVYGRPCINPRAATVQLILGDCWLSKLPSSAATVANALEAYEEAASILGTAWGKTHVATVDAMARAAKVRARQHAAAK